MSLFRWCELGLTGISGLRTLSKYLKFYFYCFYLQALLNLGTSDPSLRLAAYNLLCSVTKSFNLKIEERLLEGTGLFLVWAYLKELSSSEGGLFQAISFK